MIRKYFCILFFGLSSSIFSQSKNADTLLINDLPFSLDTLWSFNSNDSIAFASPEYNDKHWKKQYNLLFYDELDSIGFKGFGWLRIKLEIPEDKPGIIYALKLAHSGASAVYVDGELITQFGHPTLNAKDEVRIDPNHEVQPIKFKSGTKHLIAIRYSNHKYETFSKMDDFEAGFGCSLVKYDKQNIEGLFKQTIIGFCLLTLGGLFLALALIHVLFFSFYRKQKQHLYYGVFALCFSLFAIGGYFGAYSFTPDFSIPIRYFTPIIVPFYFISLMGFVYILVLNKLTKLFWFMVLIGLIIIAGFFFPHGFNMFFHVTLIIIVIIESIRLLIKGIRLKIKGIKIIAGGFALFFLMCISFILMFFIAVIMGNNINILVKGGWMLLMVMTAIVSIPVSISIYLAKNFATLNIDLEKKLVEVEDLSQQMLQQEKEKKKILEEQNTILEQQVAQRTQELSQKNKDITDSINYAKRIQHAMLASNDMLNKYFKEHFVFFKPKDIVSGDFYWSAVLENRRIALVTADSTGHGVPGAIMSMLNIACLNEAVESQKLTAPNEILNYARNKIIKNLANDGSEEGGKDGMDCSLISFDFENKKLFAAAANNPIWIVRLFNNLGEVLPVSAEFIEVREGSPAQLIELKSDKMPVGKHDKQNTSFSLIEFDLLEGDIVYTLTDGMPDQFGGPKGKKFMYKQLKEFLVQISSLQLNDQKLKLETAFENWKQGYEQVDDICIIGIRL